MRQRHARRLAAVGNDAPPEDPMDAVSRCVYTLREALRHHMMGEMLRGVRTVKIVKADGSTEGDGDRSIELAKVAEATEALRLELVKSLLYEPEFVELHEKSKRLAPTDEHGEGTPAGGLHPPGHGANYDASIFEQLAKWTEDVGPEPFAYGHGPDLRGHAYGGNELDGRDEIDGVPMSDIDRVNAENADKAAELARLAPEVFGDRSNDS